MRRLRKQKSRQLASALCAIHFIIHRLGSRSLPLLLTFELANDDKNSLLTDSIFAGKHGWTFACEVALVYFFVAISFWRCGAGDRRSGWRHSAIKQHQKYVDVVWLRSPPGHRPGV